MDIAMVCWLLFAAVSAVMADARNRSALVWAVLGFLFGPFAPLALALLGKVR